MNTIRKILFYITSIFLLLSFSGCFSSSVQKYDSNNVDTKNDYKFYTKLKLKKDTIVWSELEGKGTNQYSNKPFAKITQLTQDKIDLFLTPKEPLDIYSQPIIHKPESNYYDKI